MAEKMGPSSAGSSGNVGEDFEVFPALENDKAHNDYKEKDKPEIQSSESEKAEIEHHTAFAKKIAALPEDKWKLIQAISGTGLGLFCAFCIFVLGRTETFGSISVVIAAVAALFAPNYFEKNAGRKIPVLRKALLISLSVCLGVTLVLSFTGVV